MSDEVESVEVEDGGFEHVSTVMQPRTPVRWTPEDAANFISTTIRESQQPTLMAIKKRGISKLVYVITCLLFLAVLGGTLYYFAYYREMKWTEREADLRQEAKTAQEKYSALLEGTLKENSRITGNVVDNAKTRELLQQAREKIGTSEVELSRLTETVAGLKLQLKKITEENGKLSKSSAQLDKELQERKTEIANIEKIKTDYQDQIKKLQMRVELMKQMDKQQKQEIALLRERLSTLQKMIGNFEGEGEKPAPAQKPKTEKAE